MPLSRHQLLHLRAIVAEAQESRTADAALRQRLAAARGVPIDRYVAYLDAVEAEAQAIIDGGIFPSGLESDADVHDLVERDRAMVSVARG